MATESEFLSKSVLVQYYLKDMIKIVKDLNKVQVSGKYRFCTEIKT